MAHQNPQNSMPRFMAKAHYPSNTFLDASHIAEQPTYIIASEVMYALLWPIGSWCVILFNLIVMCSAVWNMLGDYNWWAHVQASATAVATLAALAMSHRWILAVEPSVSRYVLPPALPAPVSPPTSNAVDR